LTNWVSPLTTTFGRVVRQHVHGAAAQRQLAPIEAGEHEEVVGEPRQALRLGARRRHRLLGLLEMGVGQRQLRQLELAPQDRQRRAQLVAGVVDEAALRRQRVLDPCEESVELPGERRELAVVVRHRQAGAGIGHREPACLPRQPRHRLQRGADQEPRHRGDDDHHDGQGDPHAGVGVVVADERAGEHDDQPHPEREAEHEAPAQRPGRQRSHGVASVWLGAMRR
jgi:hypothetical protein